MPALLLHRIGDGRSELVCARSLDRLVRKAAAPIELSRLEPVEEDAEILFRLAGKPDDERGANGQLGANLTPARDALQSFFLPCGALDALEHGLGRMLKRDVRIERKLACVHKRADFV